MVLAQNFHFSIRCTYVILVLLFVANCKLAQQWFKSKMFRACGQSYLILTRLFLIAVDLYHCDFDSIFLLLLSGLYSVILAQFVFSRVEVPLLSEFNFFLRLRRCRFFFK